jgi:hypothetical protein
MHSFWYARKQRVKIGEIFSIWATLNRVCGWDRTSPLVLINDLETSVATFKFVDDVTTTEVTDTASSHMEADANEVARWSYYNI